MYIIFDQNQLGANFYCKGIKGVELFTEIHFSISQAQFNKTILLNAIGRLHQTNFPMKYYYITILEKI